MYVGHMIGLSKNRNDHCTCMDTHLFYTTVIYNNYNIVLIIHKKYGNLVFLSYQSECTFVGNMAINIYSKNILEFVETKSFVKSNDRFTFSHRTSYFEVLEFTAGKVYKR